MLLPRAIMSSGATLTSFNGFWTLVYQDDDILVLTSNYSNKDRYGNKVLWASNTMNYQVGKVTMFAHGNMVISDATGDLQWHTATANKGTGATLSLQNDGNLVIYIDGGKSVWATKAERGSRSR
ncbi:hypothetical protein CORC01_05309 [Colletotrichum orchidophilum]|uniref:Bulb-type lectin domain-containing protein n=1 Tax=Colletotrichum orchidophilum TaxID=1209926 RepID=A0A1G4BCY0_9PEZI|nr:uncharacterized protein CORC01_05309 [Colletotrichum orchidophilum]OHE99268.1 hypothetical protein CORC01_05309 [Colletotrichum orchidophilum]